jgi:hypothetical protein
MSEQKPFSKSWTVRSVSEVPALRVQVPMTKGDADPPEFLRLHARRRGIVGRLTPQPVLLTERVAGSLEDGLAVSKSLKLPTKRSGSITVSAATERAYRRYRLRRFAWSLVAGFATVIGALLLALGAIWPKTAWGKGLLWAGGGLSILAAITLVVSAWKAPPD